MVPPNSAQLFTSKEQRIPVPRNHSDLVKFDSGADRTYVRVVNLMEDCVNKALEIENTLEDVQIPPSPPSPFIRSPSPPPVAEPRLEVLRPEIIRPYFILQQGPHPPPRLVPVPSFPAPSRQPVRQLVRQPQPYDPPKNFGHELAECENRRQKNRDRYAFLGQEIARYERQLSSATTTTQKQNLKRQLDGLRKNRKGLDESLRNIQIQKEKLQQQQKAAKARGQT